MEGNVKNWMFMNKYTKGEIYVIKRVPKNIEMSGKCTFFYVYEQKIVKWYLEYLVMHSFIRI